MRFTVLRLHRIDLTGFTIRLEIKCNPDTLIDGVTYYVEARILYISYL